MENHTLIRDIMICKALIFRKKKKKGQNDQIGHCFENVHLNCQFCQGQIIIRVKTKREI